MMDVLGTFIQSDIFKYGNMVFNLVMMYVYYRLGKRRGRNEGRVEAAGLLEAQHSLILTQRQRIVIADARIANYEVRLEEARNASPG